MRKISRGLVYLLWVLEDSPIRAVCIREGAGLKTGGREMGNVVHRDYKGRTGKAGNTSFGGILSHLISLEHGVLGKSNFGQMGEQCH